jgi:hypothetical protein
MAPRLILVAMFGLQHDRLRDKTIEKGLCSYQHLSRKLNCIRDQAYAYHIHTAIRRAKRKCISKRRNAVAVLFLSRTTGLNAQLKLYLSPGIRRRDPERQYTFIGSRVTTSNCTCIDVKTHPVKGAILANKYKTEFFETIECGVYGSFRAPIGFIKSTCPADRQVVVRACFCFIAAQRLSESP